MTFEVRESLLTNPDLFAVEVAAFAKEFRDWIEHEAEVKKEEGRDDIAPIDRHHRYPPPSAHPLIAAAVNRETGMPDYEIVDDPIEYTKERLNNEVLAAASAAINRVMSPAKRRAAEMRAADIAEADVARKAEAMKNHTGILQKLKLKTVDSETVETEVSAMRPGDDNQFLADLSEKRTVLDGIHRKMIRAHSEIEDLTLDTVAGYQPQTF